MWVLEVNIYLYIHDNLKNECIGNLKYTSQLFLSKPSFTIEFSERCYVRSTDPALNGSFQYILVKLDGEVFWRDMESNFTLQT